MTYTNPNRISKAALHIRPEADVILKVGKADLRDRTTAKGLDEVDRVRDDVGTMTGRTHFPQFE